MKPLLPTLSLQVTYQCNIACKHCGPFCGPYERDWMTVDEIRDLIVQADKLGARNVVFTGGEPSLLGADLPLLLRFVKTSTKIESTRIVTNGKWATSPGRARETLRVWQEAGLDEVNVSCGEYHQEFVPISSVANAYRAARELDFSTVLLAGEFLASGKGKWSPQDFADAIGEPLTPSDLMSPYTSRHHGMSCGAAMPAGRGAHYISPEDTVALPEAEIRSRCSDVLSAITAHPNGNLTACCGVMVREDSLLTIGNWRRDSLEAILIDAHEDLTLNWIRYLGLRDMKAWLLSKDPTLKFRDRYTTICDLCQELVYNAKCQELIIADGPERASDIIAHKLAIDAVEEEQDEFVYAPDGAEPPPA